MLKLKVKMPEDKKVGKLVWQPVGKNPITVMEDKSFALLQEEKKRLLGHPCYHGSKGKFKLKYMFN